MRTKKTALLFSLLSIGAWSSQAQTWSELGTGSNTLAANEYIYGMTSDPSGNIYAAGFFYNASVKRYVAKWDGNTWSELGGTNALGANDMIYTLTSDPTGNIYAAGTFQNASGQRYVAKWNGTSWSQLGTGTNPLNTSNNYPIKTLTSDPAGNIYAAGSFTNSSGKQFVAKWNGSSWSELGTGSNALAANEEIRCIISDAAGNIYAAGSFTSNNRQYVAKWNGTSWSPLGTGTNALMINQPILSIACDQAGNIYAAGAFTNSTGKYYVAKWNGSTWTELGTGANALSANNAIYSIEVDPVGNVYAAGGFLNANQKNYVAKWNGTTWTEMGGTNALNANMPINKIILDQSGNAYAGGAFVNSSLKRYVAKYGGAFTAVNQVTVSTQGNVAPAINTDNGTLQMTATILPATASQDVTWSIVPGTGTATISATGVITAQTNGTIWAKAVSVANIYKKDSLEITLTNQSASVSADSIVISTAGNLPATITTNAGTLQLTATVFPATASQDANWSIVPGTGTATISAAGLVTAQTNGTVWAKAIAIADPTKMDSLQITISNQGSSINEQAKLLGVQLYPNPATDALFIAIDKAHPQIELLIVDISGKEVYRKQFMPNALNRATTLPIKHLSSGAYYVQLKGSDVDIAMKFIKK